MKRLHEKKRKEKKTSISERGKRMKGEVPWELGEEGHLISKPGKMRAWGLGERR